MPQNMSSGFILFGVLVCGDVKGLPLCWKAPTQCSFIATRTGTKLDMAPRVRSLPRVIEGVNENRMGGFRQVISEYPRPRKKSPGSLPSCPEAL